MALYVVTLEQVRRELYSTTLEIEASSEAEACEKAFEINMNGDADMRPVLWGNLDDEPVEAYAREATEA